MHLKEAESNAARDSLSKTIYARLFTWLVSSINLLLHHPNENKAMIGEGGELCDIVDVNEGLKLAEVYFSWILSF